MEDIKKWTKSYVRRDPEGCQAALKQTCQNIRRTMENKDPAQAVQLLDLAMNGMIILQNAHVAELSSHISFLSAVQAMIMLHDGSVSEIERCMGRPVSADGRRTTVLAALADAKDFSSSSQMKAIYSDAIKCLRRGSSFKDALAAMAPEYPDELYFCLDKVIEHL